MTVRATTAQGAVMGRGGEFGVAPMGLGEVSRSGECGRSSRETGGVRHETEVWDV